MLRYSDKLVHGAFAVLFMAMLLSPTSWAGAVEGLSSDQVAELDHRVRERWQTLTDRDYEQAWGYSTPVYRSVFPKDLYVLQFSYAVERELTGVEVLNYDAAAAVASVAVRVMSKPVKLTSAASQALGAVPVTVNEKWILVDEKWWHSASY